jgi:divalent metal cation (Fe/Co/Zn/Cd) transporter
VAVLVREKHADGRFSYGYGRCPVLVEYAGAAVLALVTLTLELEAMLRLKHHSALFRGHDRYLSLQPLIISHDVSLPFVSFMMCLPAIEELDTSCAEHCICAARMQNAPH